MSFCTAVNCMDGRVQLPVIAHLKERFAADYVDMITEAGPIGILSSQPDSPASRSIFDRIDVSVRAHKSKHIAVVGHHGCAGNPVSEARQREQLRTCLDRLARRYPQLECVGLWVDETWSVHEVKPDVSG